jgi:hypothetical protein
MNDAGRQFSGAGPERVQAAAAIRSATVLKACGPRVLLCSAPIIVSGRSFHEFSAMSLDGMSLDRMGVVETYIGFDEITPRSCCHHAGLDGARDQSRRGGPVLTLGFPKQTFLARTADRLKFVWE